MRIAALLLAAGQSRRFGPDDKLMARLGGIPVVLHAARALNVTGLDRRVAVTSSAAVANLLQAEGFDIVNVPAGVPQSTSFAAGIAALQHAKVAQIVVALGDMPFVQPSDIRTLMALASDEPATTCHASGPQPPAIFPAGWFGRLSGLTGDRGARDELKRLPPDRYLALPSDRLRDIDSQDDLTKAQLG